MAIYRFRPTSIEANPAADSGTSLSGTGTAISDANKLAAFAGQCDSVPGSFPIGFPAQNDVVAYQNSIAYFDASQVGSRTDIFRCTNMLEIGSDTPIATKLLGHTNISASWKVGALDGDVYSGFPSGAGGLFRMHGFRIELRNASGVLASTYRQFASVFEDGSLPAIINLNSNPWSPSLAAISSAFGFNFYMYNSDNADSVECTPNLGIYALELVVSADPPAGVGAKLATHPVAIRLGLSL